MNIASIVSELKRLGKNRIKFILHFGSSAHGKSTPLSDIDVGSYYEGNADERFRFRIQASGLFNNVDIHIFQDVPLTVQREMLQGKIAYVRDEDYIYNEGIRVMKEFSRFEKYYNEYLRKRMTA